MDKQLELNKLGKNIAKIRHKREMSQDLLGYEAGVDPRTISRIEVGEIEAKFYTLLKIAVALQVRVRDLVDY